MNRPNLVKMAWRNLWRNRRRTLLALSSIVFGVFLAFLFTALQDRNWAEVIDLAARLGGGHVTLQHPEFLDKPTLTRTVKHTDELIRKTLEHPNVTRAVPRIVGQVMLATARESFGAGFVAFDPQADDASTFSVLEALAEGENFPSPKGQGIILGRRLAKNLRLTLGKKVVYTLVDKEGEITSGLARVSGILYSGSPGVDSGLCLLPIDTMREVLGYAPDEATQVAVFINDQRQSDMVAERLQKIFGPDTAALPWHTTRPELAGFIALKVGGARFMELLIAVLVAAGIFVVMLVSVMERLNEFGVMAAIGFSPADLFKLVMYESLWLGLLGLLLAVVVTTGPYLYLSAHGIDLTALMPVGDSTEMAGVAMPMVLKVGIFPSNAVIIAVSALLATLLSGLYPAWLAGRVDPVETIRLV